MIRAVYVHIPFCQVKCPYCDFYSVPIADRDPGQLIGAMLAELDRYGELPDIETFYIGGGSPSCLPTQMMQRLIEGLLQRCRRPIEFTIEVNPGQVQADVLAQWRKQGVNRLSIGAQSFCAEELKTLGRRYEPAAITQAVCDARKSGFDNINCDLIFAIPGSTIESWQDNLKRVVELKVEHVSAYSLTYEKGTLFTKLHQQGRLNGIDEDTDRTMYELAMDFLQSNGWEHYEISNFARPARQCRHNLITWANESYIGIGPAAGSWAEVCRRINVSDIDKYIAAIEGGASAASENEPLSNEEVACQTAVLMLRRIQQGLDFKEFIKRTGVDARVLFTNPLGTFQKNGMLEVDSHRVRLTRKAIPIADSVLCEFAAL